MALLGDDGRGYELARKLESLGVWRTWLGDSSYSTFVQFLTSPSTWEAFMRADDSKTRAQIQLQLRARALLFDKASVSLFLRSNPSASAASSSWSSFPNSPSISSLAVAKLNPSYLQLHGDDIYFTFDNCLQDGVREGGVPSSTASSKIQPKASIAPGPKFKEYEMENASNRYKNEELPETWYNQFIEKFRVNKPYQLSADRETDRRTSEDMSKYLKIVQEHKKRRIVFKEDYQTGYANSALNSALNVIPNSARDVSSTADDDLPFFPETMFTLNCVPDSAVPPANRLEQNKKAEFYGVFDTLPAFMNRNAVMIERLGIRPENIGMERGRSLYRGKIGVEENKKRLGEEQSLQISKMVISRLLANVGFEGATEVTMEVFSQLLSCHICKLGGTLKVLADSYRKQCSANELLRMFMRTMGYSNFGPLVEHVKDISRNFGQPVQQQVPGIQSQMQPQHQGSLQMSPQMPRQMHPHLQQMVHPQNLTFQQQQQLERMRRRQQASTPRAAVEINKERPPLVQVKLEAPSEFPIDNHPFTALTARHPQMQLRQQQLAAMSNLHTQAGNQFRQQMNSLQIPQVQAQNMGGLVRAPPMKVEGFQELMGGDATKHDSDETRLTSPSNK